MELASVQQFLLWSLLINVGMYVLSLVGVLAMRSFIYPLHMRIFGIGEDTLNKVVYQYLAFYKVLLITFNFVPWLAASLMG